MISSTSPVPSLSLSTPSRRTLSSAGATLSADALSPRARISVANGVSAGPPSAPALWQSVQAGT